VNDSNQTNRLGIRRDISLKIAVISRQSHKHFDKTVMRTGLTRSQWTLIAVVSGIPGASQRTIAEHLEMSEASAGRLVDRLCSDGLLERRQDEEDRRSWRVYLTEATQPLLSQISELATELEHQVFAGFSDEDLAQFQGYLEVMYRNVAQMRDGS
jgi:MarR family transcriptional regulator, transcriptional regulator for hemolysin